MIINTKYRTDKSEIMDDFDMKGELLRDNLDEIAKINRFLGGNRLTIQGVQDLLIDVPKSREVTIVDVGCGNGDMLRILADYGLKNNWSFRLIGIDANDFTISHAKQLSKKYSNISYQCVDIFEKSYEELQYDIVLCTLTLHHFKDDEIIYLLRIFYINTNIGIVINDLHRNIIAYRLYQGVCFLFRLNTMTTEDGLTSILRGFKNEELINFSEELNFSNYKVRWKWAFRYQWIVRKIRT